ncbi:hypothetical protein BOTBODRAFT_48980 [Botryobasidium botryosum FD-172 SS1]|uniref:Uncharacterized protein n=1 Tax=Botryobasidium botryosum (strain FD-172 SS1) TaxID=930990 RepID=A0A067LUZ1_BOTB1|nr:hypothetical protein BOTBODRAFT_48980 [Botryobasidium botryosum FD-172 SS1]
MYFPVLLLAVLAFFPRAAGALDVEQPPAPVIPRTPTKTVPRPPTKVSSAAPPAPLPRCLRLIACDCTKIHVELQTLPICFCIYDLASRSFMAPTIARLQSLEAFGGHTTFWYGPSGDDESRVSERFSEVEELEREAVYTDLSERNHSPEVKTNTGEAPRPPSGKRKHCIEFEKRKYGATTYTRWPHGNRPIVGSRWVPMGSNILDVSILIIETQRREVLTPRALQHDIKRGDDGCTRHWL